MKKELIKFPVKYESEIRMIRDDNNELVCHLMWNSHRPNWFRVDEAGEYMANVLNATASLSEQTYAEYRQSLFNHLAENHDVNLLDSELDAIENIVLDYKLKSYTAMFNRITELEATCRDALQWMDGTNSDRHIARTALEEAIEAEKGK